MADSAIQWTDVTWNPVTGCTRASAGCDNCYAVTMTHRLQGMGQFEKYGGLTVLNARGDRHFNGVVRTHENTLAMPLKWKKPRRVFVNSMSDLFHRDVPDGFIDEVFGVMAATPQHTYQVLTKRPERMAEYLTSRDTKFVAHGAAKSRVPRHEQTPWPLPNVWLGTSVEGPDVKHRIDSLRNVPAAVRFLSVEPQIADLGQIGLTGIHWVIVGGESGSRARPFDIEWARSIIGQCKASGVACFVKQLGSRPIANVSEVMARLGAVDDDADNTDDMHLNSKKGGDPSEWPEDLRVREWPTAKASVA